MAVLLDPEEMSEEEMKEALREYPDHTPIRKKLKEKHNYSARQLTAIVNGDLE